MFVMRSFLLVLLLLSDFQHSFGSEDVDHRVAHTVRSHKSSRRLRATNDGELRFEPAPFNKKLELKTSGKIHCKVAGGVAPTVQWFLNEKDPLPAGMTSSNGTLLISEAERRHSGQYSCRAVDGDHSIVSTITLDIVVGPRVLEPAAGLQVHAVAGRDAVLHCVATGDQPLITHWDKNSVVLTKQQEGVEVEDGANSSSAHIVLLRNSSLLVRVVTAADAGRYGCTAGNPAGLARNELTLNVHAEGEVPAEGAEGGVAGKAVLVSVSVAGAYMLLVLALMLYCRRRRLRRRQRGEKMELEMVEGREKLVEEEGDKQKVNGAAIQNGRLLAHDKDSGADNSEVSGVSRASKKSGLYEHLSVPRTLLTEMITLGRGEFGEVFLAKIDMSQVSKLRNKDETDSEQRIKPVLVKALTAKDEVQLAEFRRQLELFSRVRHDSIVRLIGLCNSAEPHYLLLSHTDWGDLKKFLIATRTPEENSEYLSRVGSAAGVVPAPGAGAGELSAGHRVMLAMHLAAAASRLAAARLTHRDIAARNCLITSKLQLKLSFPALTRGPDSHEYYKMHEQVIPLRWLPPEAVLEGDYSTKSDVYMFAATVWEIYTKAELPFAKLNDNSVLERLKNNSLEWNIPKSMPDQLAALLKRCWSKSPADRPQFSDIYEETTTILQSITADNVSQRSHKSQDKTAE